MFNDIQALPSDFLSDPTAMVTLAVGDNPLTALPESSAAFPSLLTVYFDNTQVATLPTWLTNAELQDQIYWAYATRSPVCDTAQVADYPKIECSKPSIRAEGFCEFGYLTRNYGVA